MKKKEKVIIDGKVRYGYKVDNIPGINLSKELLREIYDFMKLEDIKEIGWINNNNKQVNISFDKKL
jgi:hypothetical protein